MDDITANALNTFSKNLKFLEKYNERLFNEITLLNLLIDEGTYKERYALEYKEEGYFDILELATNEFLYKENSFEHAKRAVEEIHFKRTGAIFKAQKFFLATDEQADSIDKSELSFQNALWATVKLTNYVTKYATAQTHLLRVNKIIFLDIGLGLHLKGIIDKLGGQVIFIKEKNLETFRLSLFVTDYEELAKDKFIYFSVTDDEDLERENFIQFLDKGNNYNLHIKHIPFTLDYESQLRRLQTHVLSQSFISYGYSAMLLRFIDSPRYLAQGYSFLNVNAMYQDYIFSKKPVLLLFSGPSTSNNLDWIKENHERFIIISALSTCRLLSSIGVVPDIVIHIDPGENSALLFEGLDYKDYFKNSSILLASNVDNETVQKFDSSKVHFIEQGTTYKEGFGRLSAPSVGEYAYGLSLIFGATNLFILGVDLALDNKTLQTHGEFHPFQAQGAVDEKSSSLNPNSTVEYVKGNFLDQVPTLAAYKISLMQIETFAKVLKREYHNTYNLSDGAYLAGCEPLHIEDYDWTQFHKLDRTEVSRDLNQFFQESTSAEFRIEDKKTLQHQLKTAKKLEKIIKKHQKKRFATVEAYLSSIAQLAWDLSDMDYKSHSDLAQVYYEYFLGMHSYICDLFNTKELTNANKHIVQIDHILVHQLLKISSLYIKKMQSYLK